MKCRYVAIEREYGSGGTKIANMLAEACGISCYGHEILERVAKEHHFTVEELERYEEIHRQFPVHGISHEPVPECGR